MPQASEFQILRLRGRNCSGFSNDTWWYLDDICLSARQIKRCSILRNAPMPITATDDFPQDVAKRLKEKEKKNLSSLKFSSYRGSFFPSSSKKFVTGGGGRGVGGRGKEKKLGGGGPQRACNWGHPASLWVGCVWRRRKEKRFLSLSFQSTFGRRRRRNPTASLLPPFLFYGNCDGVCRVEGGVFPFLAKGKKKKNGIFFLQRGGRVKRREKLCVCAVAINLSHTSWAAVSFCCSKRESSISSSSSLVHVRDCTCVCVCVCVDPP